ncbi:MAG: cell division protein SepF [Acidimicrobiia bacterium]
MATLWNKTLFYLGLVDEEEQDTGFGDQGVGDIRPIDPPPAKDAAYRPADARGQTASVTAGVRPPGALAGRRVEPPSATRRSVSTDPRHAEAGVYIHPTAGGTPMETTPRHLDPESQIIVARNFSDAQSLADAIRAGRAVILDLRSTEPDMVRRIVDFASGLTYALDGKMSKTAQGVILVTPTGVVLGVAEQERLARLGLFGDDR